MSLYELDRIKNYKQFVSESLKELHVHIHTQSCKYYTLAAVVHEQFYVSVREGGR